MKVLDVVSGAVTNDPVVPVCPCEVLQRVAFCEVHEMRDVPLYATDVGFAVIEKESGGMTTGTNVAVTFFVPAIVTRQLGLVPEQTPLHSLKVWPLAGVAVRVTIVPSGYVFEQLLPHAIPLGLEVIVPDPTSVVVMTPFETGGVVVEGVTVSTQVALALPPVALFARIVAVYVPAVVGVP